MAYAQWIEITIDVKKSVGTVNIRNAHLDYGKFYQAPDKDTEIKADVISSTNVDSGKPVTIAACGRSDAPAGTQGHFDIFCLGTKIGRFIWDNPWTTGAANSWNFKRESDEYAAVVSGGHTSGPHIGQISIQIGKFQ